MALVAAALASAAVAGYGAYSANKQAAAARKQNQQNIDISKRQQALSEQQAESALAPTTNARGDRTEYIPGVGWVETASPLSRTLMARSDQEEALRLAEDMPRARAQREAMYGQQQVERGLANAILARQNIGARSLADTEADAVRLGSAQAVAANQQQNRDAILTALRQGTGAQDVLARNDADSATNLRVALEQARSSAPRMYADAESARLNDSQTRYGQMATRAFADANIPFTPNTLADTLTTSRMSQQRTAPYGLANAAQSLKAPQIGVVDDLMPRRLQEGINGALGAYQMYQAAQKNKPPVQPYQPKTVTYGESGVPGRTNTWYDEPTSSSSGGGWG